MNRRGKTLVGIFLISLILIVLFIGFANSGDSFLDGDKIDKSTKSYTPTTTTTCSLVPETTQICYTNYCVDYSMYENGTIYCVDMKDNYCRENTIKKEKCNIYENSTKSIDTTTLSDDLKTKKSYDSASEKITFKDNSDKELSQISLVTPKYNKVLRGKDRKVLSIDILNNKEICKDCLNVEIKNLYNGLIVNKSYYWVQGIYGDVPIYKINNTCIDIILLNGSSSKNCTENKIFYYNEKKIINYEKLEKSNIPLGNSTLFLVTDVELGDYYDAIFTNMYGFKIDEWATWTDAMNNGLVFYYTFNETINNNGYMIEDVYKRRVNATWGGGFPTTNLSIGLGKINGSINLLGGTGDYLIVNNSEYLNFTGQMTIGFWVNITNWNAGTVETIVSRYNPTLKRGILIEKGADNKLYFQTGDDTTWAKVNINSPAYTDNSVWRSVVAVYNNTWAGLYINGSIVAEQNVSNALFNHDSDMWIGGDIVGGGQKVIGKTEEYFMSNRSWSSSEIYNWDNNGSAMSYIPTIDITNLIISNCSVLNTANGQYYLDSDIINSTTSNCMDIQANNVTLDCQGHTIDGNDVADNGINIVGNAFNIIQNCILTDWDIRGIYLEGSSNNLFRNISLNSNTVYGIDYTPSSKNNIIANSTITNSSLFDFRIRTNSVSDCNNIFQNVNGTNNKPIIYFNYSVNLQNWNNNFSELILCNADNSILNNINLSSNGNNGIYISRTDRTNLSNIIINNSLGLYLENYNTFNIVNNSIFSNNYYGIYLMESDSSNIIKNSLFKNNTYGVYLDNVITNNIYNNFLNNTNNVLFSGTVNTQYWNTTKQFGSNIYNINNPYIGGNFWAYPNGTGFSETCNDTNYDGFCDTNYNLTTNIYDTGLTNNIDYLSLSTNFKNPSFNITLNQPLNNTNYSSSLTFNFTVIGSEPSYNCSLYINNNLNATNSSTLNNTLTNLNGTMSDGLYNWYVNCSIYATTNQSETRKVRIDTTSPVTTATATSPVGGASYTFNTWTKNNVRVVLSSIDTGVGFNNLQYPIYCLDTTNTCVPTTFFVPNVDISTEGTSYIRYNSTDYLGNSEITKSQTIKIDSISPNITIVYPTGGLNLSSNMSINLNFSITNDSNPTDTCLFTLNNYITNISIPSCQNITFNLSDGNYLLKIWANDSLNNINNSQSVNFTVDTIYPNGTINSPINGTYNNTLTQNITINASDNLGIKNITIHIFNSTNSEINTTSVELPANTQNKLLGIVVTLVNDFFKVFADIFDWSGNKYSTQNVTFTLDNINPLISYNSNTYTNASYNQDSSLFINITVFDTNKETVRWEFNGINETFSNNNGNDYWENKTGLSEGTYYYYSWINDSVNNYNFTSRRVIYIDLNNPQVSIIHPKSKSYNYNTSLNLNYTVSDTNLQSCWWAIDGGTNNSLTCGVNTTFNTSQGSHTIYVYANDSSGRNNFTSYVIFTISLEPPSISLDSPLNNEWLNYSNVQFNYTSQDVDLGTCELWTNSTGTWEVNQSNALPNNGTTSTFNLTLPDSSYIWNVLCNDSTNNKAWGSPIFNQTVNLDSTIPLISFGYGTSLNNTNTTNNFIYINVSVTELNENNIKFSLYNSVGSYNITTFSDKTRTINWSNLPDNTYYYNVTIIDSAGNSNSTETRTIILDDTQPTITITEPQAQNYANNNSMQLNYTALDNLIGLKQCWYYIYNSSGYLTIPTVTLTTCQNTTFSLPGGDIDYTLTLFAQDNLLNTQSSSVTFGIRTNSPAISLSPSNDTQRNYINNHYFNVSVTTGTSGISSCELWSNFNGTWLKNQTKNTISTTIPNQFSAINGLTENDYLWNVWCNDSLNNAGWGLNNQSYSVDLTYPNVTLNSPTTTIGTQTFTFTESIQDKHTFTCKYSIFKQDGSIDGLNNNISFTCNVLNSATTSSYGTFNLTIYGMDKSGNENYSIQTFTTSPSTPSSPGGGGGGGTQEVTYPVIALSKPSNITSSLKELDLAIIFAGINNKCGNKITLSVVNFYDVCTLNNQELSDIKLTISNYGVKISNEELLEFYYNYKRNKVFQYFTNKENIDKYELVQALISNPMIITPSSINKYFIYKPVISDIVTSNKPVKSCEIVSKTPEMSCKVITNSTVEVYYNLTSFGNFFSNTYTGKFSVTSADKNQETKYVDFRATVYNPEYTFEKPLNIPIYVIIIVGSIIIFIGGYFLYKRKR